MNATEKHYANDWAKSKSRDLVLEMIEEYLLRFKSPNELRVLCFPGIDGAEIFEVYDKIGIPRQNIIGLEQIPSIAEEIKAKKLGIQLKVESLDEHVQGNRFNYDVVSTDFTGPISKEHLDTLARLFRFNRQNHVVFHCANLMRRDKKQAPLYGSGLSYMADRATFSSCTPTIAEITDASDLLGKIERYHATMDKAENGESLKKEKLEAFANITRSVLYDETTAEISQWIRFFFGKSWRSYVDGILKHLRFDDFIGSSLEDIISTRPQITYILQDLAFKGFMLRLKEQGLGPAMIEIPRLVRIANMRGMFYESRAERHYSYISISGSPMIGDVYYASHPEKIVASARKVARAIGYPKDLRIKDLLYIVDQVKKYAGRMVRHKDLQLDGTTSERDFLGNSSKPVLSKRRAIDEFARGASVVDLQDKYRGWSNMPLAAWKAHVTMGTYDRIKVEDEGDKITKDEAIDLLKAKIPPNEIYETFPTSFTVGQLRAFKAHITMGTY